MIHPRPPYTGQGARPDPRALSVQDARANRARQQYCPQNRLDVHQWAVNEIKTQGDDGAPSQQYFAAAAAQAADGGNTPPLDIGFEPYVFFFDSQFRDGASNLNNGTIGYTIGGLNSGQPIKDVVEIKLSPFFFPRLTWPASSPDFFFFNRIYVSLVSPFPANQAVLAANSKRYHFELDVSNTGGLAVLLTPTQDRVIFRIPITDMTGVQFVFLAPPYLTPIALPQPTLQVTAVPGSNPGLFNVTDPTGNTSAIGPIGALPPPGVAAYVNDFISGTSLDPIVNRPGGFFITNNVSLTQFQTNLNFTTLAVPILCTILIAKNRIAMQLEATCATSHPTNYVKLLQV